MNLKVLTDNQLIEFAKTKSIEEKKLTLEVINLLKEIDSRKIYLERGFSSLFDFTTKELKYEEGAALRRISAARLIRDIPQIENKIKEGKLTLTNVSQAQSFFRKEQKLTHQKLSISQKTQVLSLLENKSSREVQKTLIELSPNQIELKESQKVISKDLIEYKIVISDKLSAKLLKLKSLLSHTNPNMSQSELLEKLADMALNKLDPEVKATNKSKLSTKDSISTIEHELPPARVVKKEAITTSQTNTANDFSKSNALSATQTKTQLSLQKPSRYIPATVKQEVYLRDKGCCTFKDLKTHNRCTSKHLLQYDHIQPFSYGGKTSVQNVRLLCFNHHKLLTEKMFKTSY